MNVILLAQRTKFNLYFTNVRDQKTSLQLKSFERKQYELIVASNVARYPYTIQHLRKHEQYLRTNPLHFRVFFSFF